RRYVREVLALGEVDALLAESTQVKKARYRSGHTRNGDARWNAAGWCVRRTGRLPELGRNLTEHALGLASGRERIQAHFQAGVCCHAWARRTGVLPPRTDGGRYRSW